MSWTHKKKWKQISYVIMVYMMGIMLLWTNNLLSVIMEISVIQESSNNSAGQKQCH